MVDIFEYVCGACGAKIPEHHQLRIENDQLKSMLRAVVKPEELGTCGYPDHKRFGKTHIELVSCIGWVKAG